MTEIGLNSGLIQLITKLLLVLNYLCDVSEVQHMQDLSINFDKAHLKLKIIKLKFFGSFLVSVMEV